MAIWKKTTTVKLMNDHMLGTMCEHVGLQITELGDDYIKATMPVDHRTRQYMGIMHGGAYVVLAETIGSLGANLCCPEGFYVVGLEINANHVRAGKPPYVTGITRPLHIGTSTTVWETKIYDVEDNLVSVSRLTTMILKNKS